MPSTTLDTVPIKTPTVCATHPSDIFYTTQSVLMDYGIVLGCLLQQNSAESPEFAWACCASARQGPDLGCVPAEQFLGLLATGFRVF